MPRSLLIALAALVIVPLAAACASSEAAPATQTPVASPTGVTPTASPVTSQATATPRPGATSTTRPVATPTTPPTITPTAASGATPTVSALTRRTGQVEGVVFKIGSGSKATFTVREELVRVPVPVEAVLATSDIKGEARLDGWPTTITVNLHSLTSDQPNRDRYVRTFMFPQHPTATISIADLTPLPDGFTGGDAVRTTVDAILSVRGNDIPIEFDVEARDDGDVVYVVARAEFTWAEIKMTAPRAAAVVSVDDTVRAEILLELRPG